MSKRKKSGNIPVEVVERKTASEAETVLEIRVNDTVAGIVQQTEGEQAIVTFQSDRQQKVPTLDDGIEAVLMDYNLHNL